jgi:hypothetical protein
MTELVYRFGLGRILVACAVMAMICVGAVHDLRAFLAGVFAAGLATALDNLGV